MPSVVSLTPLTVLDHAELVQQVYLETPSFWRMHGLTAAPEGQALRDLREAEETPGRTIMGIVLRLDEENADSGHELVGIVDFRLHWPQESTGYLGILLVAEPYQRRGIGAQTLNLLIPWFSTSAGIVKLRLGVEQYNTDALLFFQRVGFTLTGETSRVQVGDRWVRLLYMEKLIGADSEQDASPNTDAEANDGVSQE